MRSCLLLKQQGLRQGDRGGVSVKEDYVGSLIARGRKEFTRCDGKNRSAEMNCIDEGVLQD